MLRKNSAGPLISRVLHDFAELLESPVGGGMRGDIEVSDSAGSDLQEDEDVENLKRSRHHNEEIAGQNRLGMNCEIPRARKQMHKSRHFRQMRTPMEFLRSTGVLSGPIPRYIQTEMTHRDPKRSAFVRVRQIVLSQQILPVIVSVWCAHHAMNVLLRRRLGVSCQLSMSLSG